ncbi:hypothetical protein RV18_GL001471 [Enterococcus termitis]|nr:hypothetical protein RV18_GL001471 [Enterococcus termitis]
MFLSPETKIKTNDFITVTKQNNISLFFHFEIQMRKYRQKKKNENLEKIFILLFIS